MSLCTLCGAPFSCGQADPSASGPCWCMAMPPAVAIPVPLPGNTTTGCWCPACLQAHIAGLPLSSSTSAPSK